MWNNLFKPVDLMQRGLSAAWTRNAVIRNNIANIETPNFKASDVEFETTLANALQRSQFVGARTHPNHLHIGGSSWETIQPRVVRREGLSMRMDGNNVDIESENVRLAQNSIYYNTLVEKMNSELRRLKMAIGEGR